MSVSKRSTKLWITRLREVLNSEWDPIGVAVPGDVEDEYDSYLSQIIAMIREGADDEALSDYLYRVETEQIGLKGNRLRLPKVIAAIRALGRPT